MKVPIEPWGLKEAPSPPRHPPLQHLRLLRPGRRLGAQRRGWILGSTGTSLGLGVSDRGAVSWGDPQAVELPGQSWNPAKEPQRKAWGWLMLAGTIIAMSTPKPKLLGVQAQRQLQRGLQLLLPVPRVRLLGLGPMSRAPGKGKKVENRAGSPNAGFPPLKSGHPDLARPSPDPGLQEAQDGEILWVIEKEPRPRPWQVGRRPAAPTPCPAVLVAPFVEKASLSLMPRVW